MTAKTDFQKKYTQKVNPHYAGISGLGDLAAEVWYAKNAEVETITASASVTAADSGKTFLVSGDNIVVSLPATALGLKYTFINITARTTAKISISPVAADGISGTLTLAASVVVDAGVVNKDIVNTKASQEVGDRVTILGTGTPGTAAWIITESAGIWAAE